MGKMDDTELEVEPCLPFSDFAGHLGAIANATRAFLLAYVAIYYVHGGEDGLQYAAYGRAAQWDINWMWPILARNLVATWVICGSWDWFLYFSPWAGVFKPFKVVPDYPTVKQVRHDAFWTTSATCTATALEWLMCHLMATGALSFDHTMAEKPLKYAFWALFLTHVREPHFYLIHRGMHPWRKQSIPDVGRFLYRHVHSLHHKSYNTTAFSGTSMHPVESTVYYGACMLAWPFACHPCVVLAIMVDCGIAAWLGHGGFVFPGTGDVYHVIHHMCFDANYGTSNVPLDWFFGTFAATYDDVKKIWSHQKAKCGAEGNFTKTHE